MRLDNFIRTLTKAGISVAFCPNEHPEQVIFEVVCTYISPTKQQYAVRKNLFPDEYCKKLRFRAALDLIFKTAMSLKDPAMQKSIMSKMPKHEAVNIPLNTGIDTLGLSNSTRQGLYRGGIRTIGSLIDTPEAQLLNLKGFGLHGVMDVKDCLRNNGLRLKE